MSFNDCDCHYKEKYRLLSEEYEKEITKLKEQNNILWSLVLKRTGYKKKFDFNLKLNHMLNKNQK